MAKLFANSGDCAASDLGLHCLPITLLRVSRLLWVKQILYDCTDAQAHLSVHSAPMPEDTF